MVVEGGGVVAHLVEVGGTTCTRSTVYDIISCIWIGLCEAHRLIVERVLHAKVPLNTF